ncbi:MAG: hypothetical protein DRI86_12295 [Bacteroidetes bacterium]|nr:MAG: hypothetical protein DRI86_12295 [Bacteroidota bacterium]
MAEIIASAKKKLDSKSVFWLLVVAFIEGSTVMAAELLGAKMTAPFFGTTIYSWAAVLAITLGGLAAGYYFGGWISSRKPTNIVLSLILVLSGIFMLFMPSTAKFIMTSVIEIELLWGLIISLMVFLFPLVFLFGMVSPVIIEALVEKVQNSGKIAGKVYAISTVGGVVNTLLMGFYIIPNYGIKMPAMAYGLLMLLTAIFFISTKRKVLFSILVILVSIIGISAQNYSSEKKSPLKIIYSSEGLLGQVKIVDYNIITKSDEILPLRGLLVNNTWQTVINMNDGNSMLDYIYFIRPLLSGFDKGSNALLIGLGAGALGRDIQSKGHNLKVVELDSRLEMLAKKYFGLPKETVVIADDGRHFLRIEKEKYDLIIFDAFLGENPPWHLLTKESFAEVKALLNPGGKLIIEFYGLIEGEDGLATRSVYKTLESIGFEVDVIATADSNTMERNFIYVAGDTPMDYKLLDYSGKKYTDKVINNLADHIIARDEFFKEESYVLTDDLPILEKMLMKPALMWRKELNKNFRDRLVATGQPIFY